MQLVKNSERVLPESGSAWVNNILIGRMWDKHEVIRLPQLSSQMMFPMDRQYDPRLYLPQPLPRSMPNPCYLFANDVKVSDGDRKEDIGTVKTWSLKRYLLNLTKSQSVIYRVEENERHWEYTGSFPCPRPRCNSTKWLQTLRVVCKLSHARL